jgi:hypothetical protein
LFLSADASHKRWVDAEFACWQAFALTEFVENAYVTIYEPKGGKRMYGVFGGYTRWAVVFLIIFVLFFLLVPGYGYGTTGATC